MAYKFYTDLFQVLTENIYNNYNDNYDYLRFGVRYDSKKKRSFKRWVIKYLNSRGYFSRNETERISKRLIEAKWVPDFEHLYEILEEKASRDLLISVIAYRLLGRNKVKLPLNTPGYWEKTRLIQSHQDNDNYIQIKFMDFKLYYHDLSYLDLPIKIYFTTAGVRCEFVVKQYDFIRDHLKIAVAEGDTVIDGGSCFGDMALYFAYKTGLKGSVYAFEFIPSNLEVWKKNIALNPALAPLISLVENPLWSESGVDLYFESYGPASKVSFEKFDKYDGIVQTISIDDYVNSKGLSKIDFIKLDIEGAELSALRGAINTLKKYKPKLAIALYHRTEDFYTIPKFLEELNVGYKYYLAHATIHAEETILFATCA